MTIQWFPGHMAKAIREIKEKSSQIDVVIEVLDARAPGASRNPVLGEVFEDKLRLIILNKADLCDAETLGLWVAHFKTDRSVALPINALTGRDAKKIRRAIVDLYSREKKAGRAIRAVVFGVPNVGKSTLINHLSGKRIAKAEDRPGVTKHQKWLEIGNRVELLDTPGILWPKFETQDIARKLAAINCIKDQRFESEEIAFFLCEYLLKQYSGLVEASFKIEGHFDDALSVFNAIGKRRGCFISGNEIDLDRVYDLFIRSFRSGKLGPISLETPTNDGGVF